MPETQPNKAMVSEFDAYLKQVMPKYVDKQNAKAEAKSVPGVVNFATATTPAPDIQFCALCLSVRKTVNTLISMFGWLIPGSAAVKAFMDLFFAKIYPLFCPTPPTA